MQWTRQASSRRPTPPNVRNRTREGTLPRKDILSKFGITDRADLRVQVIEKEGSVPMVDVHGPGDPVKTLTPKQAESCPHCFATPAKKRLDKRSPPRPPARKKRIGLGRHNPHRELSASLSRRIQP